MRSLGQALTAGREADIELHLLTSMRNRIEPFALDLQSATDAREVGARQAYLKVLEMIDRAIAARRAQLAARRAEGGRRG